ncbi:hypothetical protein ABIE26_003955 [Pedobacter africanus]
MLQKKAGGVAGQSLPVYLTKYLNNAIMNKTLKFMNQETQHPSLVIESPNGTVIKLYHSISEEYLKELLDEFLVEKKVVTRPNT